MCIVRAFLRTQRDHQGIKVIMVWPLKKTKKQMEVTIVANFEILDTRWESNFSVYITELHWSIHLLIKLPIMLLGLLLTFLLSKGIQAHSLDLTNCISLGYLLWRRPKNKTKNTKEQMFSWYSSSRPSETWNYVACLDGTSAYITTEAILPVCMVTLNFPLNDGAIFYSNALQPQQVRFIVY